jgi:hypothetical protein
MHANNRANRAEGGDHSHRSSDPHHPVRCPARVHSCPLGEIKNQRKLRTPSSQEAKTRSPRRRPTANLRSCSFATSCSCVLNGGSATGLSATDASAPACGGYGCARFGSDCRSINGVKNMDHRSAPDLTDRAAVTVARARLLSEIGEAGDGTRRQQEPRSALPLRAGRSPRSRLDPLVGRHRADDALDKTVRWRSTRATSSACIPRTGRTGSATRPAHASHAQPKSPASLPGFSCSL